MLFALAPMDGITDGTYRYIVGDIFPKLNHIDDIFFVTEFMSADGFLVAPRGVGQHLLTLPSKYPTIVQIFGGDLDKLVGAAQILQQKYNFYGIELNIGCPSARIVACGAGSGMLQDKARTLSIIKELRKHIKFFSIKTRIGLRPSDLSEQMNFIIDASQYCDMISLHGRYFSQAHSGDVDRETIYSLRNLINPACKLVGNGGIRTYNQSLEKLNNLDGIMIGQASIGNPWIFTSHKPTNSEILQTILYHLDLSMALEIYYGLDESFDVDGHIIQPDIKTIQNIIDNFDKIDTSHLYSPLEFRKHLFNYISGLSENRQFKQSIIHIKDYSLLRKNIIDYFTKIG